MVVSRSKFAGGKLQEHIVFKRLASRLKAVLLQSLLIKEFGHTLPLHTSDFIQFVQKVAEPHAAPCEGLGGDLIRGRDEEDEKKMRDI